MLHLALGRLRWAPETLWRATPRELALALAPPPARQAGLSADLSALMALFPDT